jgi:polysaccharide export outer membrane protein
VYFQLITLPMRRILVLPIVAVLVSPAGAPAQSRRAAPPSVSCLGPEGESYLRDLLARIQELEKELDAAKQVQLAEREKQARRLADKEAEISERAAALSDRERSRAADLEAAKQEVEKLRASSGRAADAEKQLATLREAIEEANEARRKAEGEIAAAKRDAARESQAREDTERRFTEREERERTAAASSRRTAEIAAAAKEASPPAETESAVAPPPSPVRTKARTDTEAAPSAKPSEGELAAAQLAALSGKSPPPAPSEPHAAAPDHARRSERILPGENVTLRVAKVEELNRTVEVADDGSIDLPLVGTIQAAGRTEPELVADLRERLTAYLKEPQVEVSRDRAEPPRAPIEETKPASEVDTGEPVRGAEGSYSVEGQVARPGTYQLTEQTTVTSAIAAAGGASFAARLDEVEIEHPKGGTEARHEIVNVAKLGKNGGSDVPIRAGDVVRVPGSSLWALPWGFVRIVTFPFWYPFS